MVVNETIVIVTVDGKVAEAVGTLGGKIAVVGELMYDTDGVSIG